MHSSCAAVLDATAPDAAGDAAALLTDALPGAGFRRYDRIRETLLHELAHMVWVSGWAACRGAAAADSMHTCMLELGTMLSS